MCVSVEQERGLQEELQALTLRMAEKEEVLQETVMRLRSTSRTKESMEHFIVNQRTNLRVCVSVCVCVCVSVWGGIC